MQITSRFTIAIHIITCIDYFQGKETLTSAFLAGSVGANPVIIRQVVSKLREAGILNVSQGKTGIRLNRPMDQITFYDVYKALDCLDKTGLFHFHESPNTDCPVGRHIHEATVGELDQIQSAMEDAMRQITVGQVAQRTREEIALEEQ